jgi:hypothetical protein
MTALTEGRHAGEFLLSELPGSLSRDAVTVDVPAGEAYEAGTVLGQLSGTGHYVPYDDAASDGSETAAAILHGNLDNSDGVAPLAADGVVINFGAEVRDADLIWGNGVDETAGLAGLRAVGIKARA